LSFKALGVFKSSVAAEPHDVELTSQLLEAVKLIPAATVGRSIRRRLSLLSVTLAWAIVI
jgi:hypothetical protein